MNDVGILFLGAVARVTVLGLIGLALAMVLKRRGPSAVALTTLATLSGLLAVSALSLSPWPRLWSLDLSQSFPEIIVNTADAHASDVEKRSEPNNTLAANKKRAASSLSFAEVARLFVEELRSTNVPDSAATRNVWRWPAWIALGLIAAMTLGLTRLALALRAVALLRRRSKPNTDACLRDEVDLLRAEMGCLKEVEIYETSDLTTPATIGWRRPALLFPNDWIDWRPDERRAAIAHELAHVQEGDYLSGVWAQLCLSVHLYHPLAHWLVARLRLDQELAADAKAARLSGGSRLYLEALARLALRRPGPLEPSPSANLWPARPFLPTRGMFLRRMEMLHDPNSTPLRTEPLRPLGRALTIAALSAAALIVAGFRGPLQAQQDAPRKLNLKIAFTANTNAADPDVFDLSHAPAETMIALAGRPSVILNRPEFKPVTDLLKPDGNSMMGSLNIAADEIESFQVLFLNGPKPAGRPGPPFSAPPILVLHTTKPQDWNKVAGKFVGNPEIAEFEGQKYTRTKSAPVGAVFCTINDRTIVIGPEADLKSFLLASKGKPIAHKWDKAWSKVVKGQLAAAVDPAPFAAFIPRNATPGSPQAALASQFGMFSPMIDQATGYAKGIDLEKGMAVDLVVTTPDAASAKSVEETLSALLTLGKNAAKGLRQQAAADQGPGEGQLLALMLDLGVPLLNSTKILHPEETVVEFQMNTDKDTASTVKIIVPAIMAARATARQAQDMNNMKQIGLAMHNFHASNNHLPPAVLTDKPGKIPYSWRVAILPYIDQQALYDQYDFSEPWDGPKNKKLLEKIPAIYQHPLERGKSFNTSYYVPTGDVTLFPPGDAGIGFEKVLDGTSITIMTIEAKLNVPWTKPEDFPVNIDLKNPNQPAPVIPTYTPNLIMVGWGDGGVRGLPTTINSQTLRALFTRAAGEVINWNAIDNHPGQPRPATAPQPTPGPPLLPGSRIR